MAAAHNQYLFNSLTGHTLENKNINKMNVLIAMPI